MSEYSWPWENYQDRAATARAAWTETVRALPIGTQITGEVVGRQPFGVFLAIDGRPDAVGLAKITAMPRCLDLPAVGQRVTGEVVWHADHNHQVGVTLDAWAHHEDLLPTFADRIGQVVNGRVTKTVPIGTFVRIAHCVEGLVPSIELPARPRRRRGRLPRKVRRSLYGSSPSTWEDGGSSCRPDVCRNSVQPPRPQPEPRNATPPAGARPPVDRGSNRAVRGRWHAQLLWTPSSSGS